MTNKTTCENCKYGIDVNANGKVKLCENPSLKTHCKNVKHGRNFACGYGVKWNEGAENENRK